MIFSFPSNTGHPSSELLNQGARVQILGLKPNTPIASAVEQVAFILESLNVKIAIKIDLDYDDVIRVLNQTAIKSRVIILDSH